MARRMLTFADQADIAVGIESGLSDAEIAKKIDRNRTIVWRERRWQVPDNWSTGSRARLIWYRFQLISQAPGVWVCRQAAAYSAGVR